MSPVALHGKAIEPTPLAGAQRGTTPSARSRTRKEERGAPHPGEEERTVYPAMNQNSERHVGFSRVMRNPSFQKLWIGQVISQFGDGFYWLAIMLGVSAISHESVHAIGLVSMAFMLPQLPIGIFGGPLVDMVNRRRLMVWADASRIFTTLALIAAYRAKSLPFIYALALVQSGISGMFGPAKNALIPQVVEPEDLLSANTLSQSTQVAAMIFGPATAGITIEHFGIPAAFVVDAVTFLLSAVFLLWMAPVPDVGRTADNLQQAWGDLWEGVRFLLSERTLVALNVTVGALFLGLGAVDVLWVPYMQRIFHLGAEKIGFIDGMQGVGMLVGTLLMGTALLRNLENRELLLGGIAVVSVSFIAIGVAPAYFFILLSVFALGLASVPAEGSFMTMVQSVTPERLLGRVNGTIGALVNGAMLVSMALAASAAEIIGLRESYVVCGVIGLLSVLVGTLLIKGPGEHNPSNAVSVERR